MTRLRQRWSWLVRRRRRDADLREELQFHVDEEADERVDAGADPSAALQAARRDLGNAARVMEDTRAVWTSRVLERLAQDLRYAVRRMAQSPVFSLIAMASLALGIGANSAVFSLFNEVLLRPLPVPDPAGLVNLAAPGPKHGGVSCNQSGSCDAVFSYPMFRDLQREQTPLIGLAGHKLLRANLAYAGQTLSGQGALVSGRYFSVLGIAPAFGRLIGPDDDRAPGGAAVAVLAYDYWTERFDAARDVVGKTMTVNGQTLTIVGVGPQGFIGTAIGTPVDVFVPITMRNRLEPPFDDFNDRSSYWVYVFGRLTPGVSIDQARASLNGTYRAILTSVDVPAAKGLSASELSAFANKALVVDPGALGQSNLHAFARTPLAMLFVVTGIVLAIACANLANLLLARSAARGTEMAVRASIGASRRRLIGQLLVESCVLAFAGGAAGLVLGEWLLVFIRHALTPIGFPAVTAHADLRVLGFCFALSLATGLLFGVFPALHGTRVGLAAGLKQQGARSSGTRSASRFRATMIVAQMALSTLLLVSAGLFIRSLVNIGRVDLGITVDHMVTFTVYPRFNGYTPAATRDLIVRTEAALAAAPGTIDAASSTVPLLGHSNASTSVSVQKRGDAGRTAGHASYSDVGAGFFRTVGIPVVAGREFTTGDTDSSPKVAIVNEAFARSLHLGADVIGARVRIGDATSPEREIVGLVRDAKYDDVKGDAPALFYLPYRQNDHLSGTTFYARTAADPATVLAQIPAVMAAIDPDLPLEDARTMADQVRVNEAGDRVIATLALSFALIATVLAAIGLYGVLAYIVAQRTREFGVRMAIGAAPGQVRRLVLRNVIWLTAVGSVLGGAAALAAGRSFEALLYQMNGRDPWVVIAAVGTLALVALAAGFVPAWRASRIDPVRALRYE